MRLTCSFTGFFALLKGPTTLRQSASSYITLVTDVITDLSNLTSKCVWNGPDFAVVLAATAHVMFLLPGERRKLLVKHKISVKAVTLWAPPDSATLTAMQVFGISLVSKISAWKHFFFSDSSESTCVPERPLVHDSWMGCLLNSVLSCMCSSVKKAIAQVKRKM